MTLYISTDGNDEWNGRTAVPKGYDGPFATVHGARLAVRSMISDGLDDDILVLLREGLYHLPETVVFDEYDSPPDGLSVTYQNYPGERPCISGGERITAWKKHRGPDNPVYTVPLSGRRIFHTFSENGRRAVAARFPKTGYERSLGPVTKGNKSHFMFDASRFPRISDPSTVRFYGFGGGEHGVFNWFSDTVDVEEYHPADGEIVLSDEIHYEMGPGSRFALMNAYEFLTDPGEFYLGPDGAELYYLN